jgi:catechol 2,3-dioxygenase-like lactoylglutathione lyase family enzyme
MTTNDEFELRGVNHVALVCRDMARTVDFYTTVLGMPLVKTIELPDGAGQHFFFDVGNGDCVAFFWFPGATDRVPGVSGAPRLPDRGDSTSAVASMNHLAFNISPEHFDEYIERLHAKGIHTSRVLNHDDSERTVSREVHPGVYIRSVYFFDPDGILLEFAAWTRELGPGDVRHAPASTLSQAG